MTEFGRPIFGQFSPLLTSKKKVIFAPPHIHLRVQHIPLINLMGLMTFCERTFEILAPHAPKSPLYHKRDKRGSQSSIAPPPPKR